mgnify:CR=1 FL=1
MEACRAQPGEVPPLAAQFDLPVSADPEPRLPLQGWISSDYANRLFAAAGQDFAALRDAAGKKGFTGVDLGTARDILDTARVTVAAKRYRLRESDAPLGEITFSAGISAAIPGDGLSTVFHRADRLLYAAKTAGRNRLHID